MEKPLIVLGICASIAAVRCFDLCRELKKNNFDVQVLLSDSAKGIVTESALEFASGKKVISSLSGSVEHVKFFGKNGKASLLLIAPATANTISKIALGIDDTVVTTFATIAIGSGKPVLLAPAMHEPMYEHPIIRENLEKLSKRKVRIIPPLLEEGKAKLAEIERVVFEVQKELSEGLLEGKKVLVASGAFREKIDDVRVITNNSSGKLGNEIALACAREKAAVKVIGNGKINEFLETDPAFFADELEEKALRELEKGHDYFICPAAIPDFSVKKQEGKISSKKALTLTLKPREKMLEKVRRKFPSLKIVAFKALFGKSKKEVESSAKEFLKSGFSAVVATDLAKNPPGSESGEFFFFSKSAKKWIDGSKGKVADEIVHLL